jgi:hypothetical protein
MGRTDKLFLLFLASVAALVLKSIGGFNALLSVFYSFPVEYRSAVTLIVGTLVVVTVLGLWHITSQNKNPY